ncbi:glycosyltransferase family A protein [Marinimicrobium sp. ABcell2]|uniref:glycosyltransferase family 2 protein n=1 Tax=Marinimicrobium sp. ABcell2 TaxID=3069751 RepID=UPI0027B58DE7|nr:glycosyltransferase family A protein [Marinimicrobium sp. ABcell2]MDQ2076174.1 glycosyltransferase family A protein [Marinimicrobium sp. ABcell2]
MPFFSVVIPTFNRESMVADAIEAALSQDFTDYEIIVVDDGSTDGTARIVEAYGAKVQYYRQDNAGVATARNTGVALSHGEYICYLDSDDLWPQTKLSEYKDVIDQNPGAPFIFSDFHKHNVKNPKPYEISNSEIFPYIFDLAEPAGQNTYTLKGDSLLRLLLRGYPLYPSTFAIHRSVHNHYRWDPGILKSEDFNLVLKLSCQYPFLYIDQSLATVRVHDSNKSSDFITKNHINTASMKLLRDLYLPKSKRSLCNHYISQKYFGDGTSYFKKGLYRLSVANIVRSLGFRENWVRLMKSTVGKLWRRENAQ